MSEGQERMQPVARILLVSASMFLVLAGLTSVFGTRYGLDGDTANLLSIVFLFVAVADALIGLVLARSGKIIGPGERG